MRNLLFLIVALLISVTSLCGAAEPNERWWLLSGSEKQDIYLDLETIRYEPVGDLYTDHDGHSSANIWLKFDKKAENAYLLNNVILDLDCRTYYVGAFYKYDYNNEQILKHEPKYAEFKPAVPGSFMESLCKIMADGKAKQQ